MPSSTTAQAPTKQAPMEAVTSVQDGVVSTQPTGQQPMMQQTSEPTMSMRGGGLFCGWTCCDGQCRFHKDCC